MEVMRPNVVYNNWSVFKKSLLGTMHMDTLPWFVQTTNSPRANRMPTFLPSNSCNGDLPRFWIIWCSELGTVMILCFRYLELLNLCKYQSDAMYVARYAIIPILTKASINLLRSLGGFHSTINNSIFSFVFSAKIYAESIKFWSLWCWPLLSYTVSITSSVIWIHFYFYFIFTQHNYQLLLQ